MFHKAHTVYSQDNILGHHTIGYKHTTLPPDTTCYFFGSLKIPQFAIDCSLDWKEKIKAVSAKASRAVGFLEYAKSFLPKETLQTLYTGILVLTFDTAVVSGAGLFQRKSTSYENFKSVLLG